MRRAPSRSFPCRSPRRAGARPPVSMRAACAAAAMPALLTQTSTGPSSDSTRSRADSTDALLLTSASTAMPPTSVAVSAAASAAMSRTATFAPSAASRMQIASPMPEPPPVTTATFPSSVTGRPPHVPRPRRRAAAGSRRPPRRGESCSISISRTAGPRERDDLVQLGQRPPRRPARGHLERHAPPNPIGKMPPPRPTMLTWPPIATMDAASCAVESEPTKSSTSAAPAEPVSTRTSPGSSPFASSAACAPAPSARRRASSRMSIATMRAGVSSRSSWTATCPSPPTPITTAVEPGRRWCCSVVIAWYGVSAASVSGAAAPGRGRRSARAAAATGRRRTRRARRRAPRPQPPACRLGQRFSAPRAQSGHDAAAPRPVDEDGVALGERRHAGAERGDHAGGLVAERERQRPRQRPLGPLHQMKVGVAETGRGDLDEHGARSRLGHLHLSQLGLRLPADELDRVHSAVDRDRCRAARRTCAARPRAARARTRSGSRPPAPRTPSGSGARPTRGAPRRRRRRSGRDARSGRAARAACRVE